MQTRKKHYWLSLVNVLIFTLAVTLFDSGIADISIKTATPVLCLSLLTVFACFRDNLTLISIAGILCGASLDSLGAGSYCFNTLLLFLLSVSSHILSNRVFNKNLKATACLCFLQSMIYFLLYWLIFIAFSLDFDGNSHYLLTYALPSAFYTAVLTVPLYPLFKHFSNLRNEN